jgi:adenosylhomocysteinase
MNEAFSQFRQNKSKDLLGFPILEKLGQYLSANEILKGKTIGWHCHLTDLTAYAVEVVVNAGIHLHLSECNRETTSAQAVAFMQSLGATIHRQNKSDEKAKILATILKEDLDIISDTGFVLTPAYLQANDRPLIGACEITSSGISQLRKSLPVSLPVVNINNSNLKSQIENFHGVGDGVVDALYRLTGKMWAGSFCSVIGYGQVGRGVAHHLRQKGLLVSVVETNPVKRLIAHYDGFAVKSLIEALASSNLTVTATGQEFLLTDNHWQYALDEMLLLNVGHLPSEIDRQSLIKMSGQVRAITKDLEEFELITATGKKRLYLACGGNPANVVLLSGSIEPTLIHLTTEILSWHYLATMAKQGSRLPFGEIAVPEQVETMVSEFALSALQRTTSEPLASN